MYCSCRWKYDGKWYCASSCKSGENRFCRYMGMDYCGNWCIISGICFARLATNNPQTGGPIAYAGEVAPIFGHQTSILYYHANWIGNLAIAITAVAYLSVFFPVLNNPVPAAITSIAMVWLFTFVNLLGGAWVSRLTSIGLVLVLIPVVGTALFGWGSFDIEVYRQNWMAQPDGNVHQAVINSVLLCLWAFVGVESAAVSSDLVHNPSRTVPLATLGELHLQE